MEKLIYNQKIRNFRIQRIVRDCAYSMPANHFHNYCEIYYLVEGDRFYFVENATYHVKKGDLVFITANQIHKTYVGDNLGHERILIEFEEEFLERIEPVFGCTNLLQTLSKKIGLVSLDETMQKYVEQLFGHIADELARREEGYQASIRGDFIQLLVLILRNKDFTEKLVDSNTSPKHKKIQEIASYISQHYSENISLDKLASEFYISKFHLCHLFKEITNFTVIEYINAARMKEARVQLLNTSDKISQIAEAIGYESVAHFERVFKDFFGRTPIGYRKFYAPQLVAKPSASPKQQKEEKPVEKLEVSPLFC